jgi:MFS family permease
VNRTILKNKNLLLIFLVTASAMAAASSIAPALPQIAEHFGIQPEDTGLILLSFTLPGIIFSAIWGILSDRIGRKITLVISLAIFAIGSILSALNKSFNFLLVMRFIQGLGASALFSLNAIIIGDLFTGEERAIAMGYNASVISISFAIFPFLGGILSEHQWNLPFLLPSFSLILVFLVARFFKVTAEDNRETFSIYFKKIIRSMRNKYIIGILIGTLLFFAVQYGVFINYFSFLTKKSFGYSSSVTGSLIAISLLISAFISSYTGKLKHVKGFKILYVLSFFVFASSFILMPFSLSPVALLIGIALFGIGQGINMPLTSLLITEFSPEDQRGALLSINCMVLAMGQTLGPLIFRVVYKQSGLTEVFIIGAIVTLFAMITVIITFRSKKIT